MIGDSSQPLSSSRPGDTLSGPYTLDASQSQWYWYKGSCLKSEPSAVGIGVAVALLKPVLVLVLRLGIHESSWGWTKCFGGALNTRICTLTRHRSLEHMPKAFINFKSTYTRLILWKEI